METYTLLAWLPGTFNFGVKNAAGLVGWLSINGFVPMFDRWIESACHKYGYIHLPAEAIEFEPSDAGIQVLVALRTRLDQQYPPI